MTVTPIRGASSSQRVLVVAAAGYGKTSALEAGLARDGWRGSAHELLAQAVPVAPQLAVDDLDALSPTEQLEVVRRLGTLPGEIGLMLASRAPLGPQVRCRLRGQVFERGPADLALSPREIARILEEEYGVTDPEAPVTVAALTCGWAALVHFAGDALARGGDLDLRAALTRPGSDGATWLRATVLDELPPAVSRVLDLMAGLEPLAQDLVDEVLSAGGSGADSGALAWLRRTGLVVPYGRRCVDETHLLTLVPVVADVLSSARPAAVATSTSPRPATALAAAAAWYVAHDLPYAAALTYERLGDVTTVEHLIVTRSEHMLAHGHAPGVVALVERHSPPGGPTCSILRTYAEALRRSGDASAAQRAFAPLVEAADRRGWDAGLAHAVAGVHYLRGALHEALEVLDRVDVTEVGVGRDGIEWRTRRAHVLSLLGQDGPARIHATEALALADASGDPRSRAAAHLAAAKTSLGTRKEAHLAEALAAARAAGDLVLSARILVSQSYVLLAAARYRDAVAVGRHAVAAADLASPSGLRAAALHNLGEALARAGDYDEARWHLRRAIGLARTLGPGRTAMGLLGIAEISRQVGHDERGRAEYDEAITLARASGERQVLVPALAGAARLLCESAPAQAIALADEAVALATEGLAAFALTAAGWVARSNGDHAEADRCATAAVRAARADHALDALAEALELAATASDDPGEARAGLSEALAIWRDGGAEPAASRVEVLLGRLDGADSTDRSRARDATRRLHRMGVLRVNGRPITAEPTTKQVTVAVLGGFTVLVGGQPVPLPAWRSRQARTLVKVLASRRGRPITRSFLCELLWPDDDPARTGHRLSVLLATVRAVLDPDRTWPPDHYLASDPTGIWLDLRHVALDADCLLQDAAHATDLLARSDPERAREILTDVDARYRGDAFEDEPYEAWTDGLREETRAAWIRCLRHLATLARRESRTSEAHELYVRLLVADPHDERVHRALVEGLVRAGRYGEARRAFDRWTQAMDAVDAPRPDPSVLAGAEAPTAPRPAHLAPSVRRPRAIAVLTPR